MSRQTEGPHPSSTPGRPEPIRDIWNLRALLGNAAEILRTDESLSEQRLKQTLAFIAELLDIVICLKRAPSDVREINAIARRFLKAIDDGPQHSQSPVESVATVTQKIMGRFYTDFAELDAALLKEKMTDFTARPFFEKIKALILVARTVQENTLSFLRTLMGTHPETLSLTYAEALVAIQKYRDMYERLIGLKKDQK